MNSLQTAWHQRAWWFIGLCFAAWLFGGLFQPGGWYQELNRAPWSPPNIAFPIVWSCLYIMIAIAGFKAARQADSALLWLWYGQLFFNAAWSWLFFGQHWVAAGLIDLCLILILVGALILRALQLKLTGLALLLVPYLLWLGLATSLNAYILLNN